MEDRGPLYQRIADSIRQEILQGLLHPGDLLPSVRLQASKWGCTPGTVHQAYRLLAEQNLVVSRTGQGTRIGVQTSMGPQPGVTVQRALLVHQAEAFLLAALSAGNSPEEVEHAFRTALDRWRTMEGEPLPATSAQTLRFIGSHDPAVTLIAARFPEISPGATFQPLFSGSLGGLIALAEGKADLSGCHLWDEETDSYNAPFVRRLLPGRRVHLVTLAHRRLGLLVAPRHQNRIGGLGDLTQDLRFVNRQRGAGTRVWLDAHLRLAGIRTDAIRGYDREAATHSEVARLIAEDSADVGLGIEAAALVFGLGFIPLTLERYDLIVPEATWATTQVQSLAAWLSTSSARAAIRSLGGYDTRATGEVSVVDEAPRTSPQTR